MKNDIKELAMDDTAKAVNQRHMESSMSVLETLVILPMSQHETGETEGGSEEAKDTTMVKDGIKKGKVGSWSGRRSIQPERKLNQMGADSAKSRLVEPTRMEANPTES